ncbi:MAG: ABC transporter ATP-binding protein, partial [Acetobacteraceae bacterium]
MKAPAIAVEDLSLQLGAFALNHVRLAVAPGEILALLGPNGAGKSTTLETIAGFHRPREGRILIAGRDVTLLPPERRDVGLVFQNYGLFPHLTVAANVAFSLGAKGAPHARRAAPEIRRLLARFGIEHLAHRYPHDLSPGEKQRTALARALVREPELFLFDEPFAALDARTREGLRDELGAFLRDAGIPAIFVTHDQADATVLADRVAIMNCGAIAQ